MKILNREVELDLLDVESFTKYENALNKYMNKLEQARQFKGKESEGRKLLCNIVYEFFDELLGQGTSIQLLGDKPNYRNCIKAMQEIIEEKLKSDQEVSAVLNKYSLGAINEYISQ